MNALPRRSRILGGLMIAFGLVIGFLLLRFADGHLQSREMLRMRRGNMRDSFEVGTLSTNVILDELRQKYPPSRRIDFRVTCVEDASIFVLATGVQVYTPSGWRVFSEENRGEIWRLKPGVQCEVCVEGPQQERWRAFVRYGREMNGPSLLTAQIKEAWKIRSFSNWSGKAWGGGRFIGAFELFSDASF